MVVDGLLLQCVQGQDLTSLGGVQGPSPVSLCGFRTSISSRILTFTIEFAWVTLPGLPRWPHLHFLQPGTRSHCAGPLSRVFLHWTRLGPEGCSQVPFLGGMGSPPREARSLRLVFGPRDLLCIKWYTRGLGELSCDSAVALATV